MNHTKEPWYKHKGNTGIIYGNDGISIAAGHNNDIADRIVACVNACAGITNEALDAGVVGGCIEIVKRQTPEPDDKIRRWKGVTVFEEDV